jgi:DNA polymerase III subunit delta'
MTFKSSLIGHQPQRESIRRLFEKGKFPSTVLFAGPAGIGKKLVALEVARSLLCENGMFSGCGKCKACRLVDAGNFPDFYLIECADRERWNVEQIKELLYSLNLTSCFSRGRVIVFNDAEFLHIASANALLKSLEEPRANTWFILVSANPSKLPPTVLSRSQTWFFNPLAHEEVQHIIAELKDEIEGLPLSLDELVVLADGAPGSITAIKDHSLEWMDLKVTMSAIHGGDARRAVSFASEISKDKEDLRERLTLLRIYARHRMYETPQDSLWALCVTNLIAAERLIFERNLNAQYVLSNVLLNLVSSADLNSFTTLTNSAKLLERIVV